MGIEKPTSGKIYFNDEDITDLEEQYQTIKKIMENKWHNLKYIAYFQAFTNTYAPLEKLKSLYEAGMMEKDEYLERVESVEADYRGRY